jgi:hypothetical protein
VRKFWLALCALAVSAGLTFTGVSPAAAVSDKNTLTKTCTISGTSTAWSAKLGLKGSATGYQPKNVQVIGKSGTYSSVRITGYTVYWYNSSGTLLQAYDYAVVGYYASGSTWKLIAIAPSNYTVQLNYLWRVKLVSNGNSLCTTALST